MMGADGRFVVEMLNERHYKEAREECARLRALLDRATDKLDRLRAENEALRALLRECRPVVMTYSPSGKPFDFPRELVDRIDAALTPNAPFSGPGANE